MKRDELERAFSKIPKDCYNALMSAAHSVREEKVMKRKLSLVFVFSMVAILTISVAIAVVISLRDTGQKVLEIEQTEGYYLDWSSESKLSLVRALVDLNYVEKTSNIEDLLADKLAEKETNRLADEIMVAFTKLPVSEISFMSVMEAGWGPFDSWSFDEKAWYSQLLVDMNLQKEDHAFFVMPEGDIDAINAIAIARQEVEKAFKIENKVLDEYIVVSSFQVPEFSKPDDNQPYWYVEFTAPESLKDDEQPFGMVWAFIHPKTGALLEPLDGAVAFWSEYFDLKDSILLQNDVTLDFDKSFGNIEDMYGFKERWEKEISKIRAAETQYKSIKQEGVFNLAFMASLEELLERIAMPGADDISVDAALKNAEKAIMDGEGWNQETMSYFVPRVQVYLQNKDKESSIYHFVFTTKKRTQEEMNGGEAARAFDKYIENVKNFFGSSSDIPIYISIRIDAKTGLEVGERVTVLNSDENYTHYRELLVE